MTQSTKRAEPDDSPAAEDAWFVEVLLEIGQERERQLRAGERRLANDEHADQLLHHDAFARLIGMLAQQHRTRAGRAWELPFRAKSAMGHLDPSRIASNSEQARAALAVRGFTQRQAEIVARAAERVVQRFDGDAASIWSTGSTASEVSARIRGFYGAGPKISAMAPAILVRAFGAPLEGSDEIAVDANVRRVFQRLGLVSLHADDHEVRERARRLWPESPASLDLGAWVVGADWCRAVPLCAECPLRQRCPARTT